MCVCVCHKIKPLMSDGDTLDKLSCTTGNDDESTEVGSRSRSRSSSSSSSSNTLPAASSLRSGPNSDMALSARDGGAPGVGGGMERAMLETGRLSAEESRSGLGPKRAGVLAGGGLSCGRGLGCGCGCGCVRCVSSSVTYSQFWCRWINQHWMPAIQIHREMKIWNTC